MASPCTVLIAAEALLPALVSRVSVEGREVISFTDGETLRALETITSRRPPLVAVERGFAATPRGAALINRIKADPALSRSEVRIVAQDSVEPVATPAAVDPPMPVDGYGTRRAARYTLAGAVDATIDGSAVTLVDLSTLGAQIISANVLRPNQRVRMAIADGKTTMRASGTIVWARFEIPPGSGPRYRAGIEFVTPDTAAIDAFCRKHRP